MSDKKKHTRVPREKLEAIYGSIQGIRVEEKEGWTKLMCTPDGHSRRVYVPQNKSVRRIDLAGFGDAEFRNGGVIPHENGTFGSVTLMIDPELGEESFLAVFREVLETGVLLGDNPNAKKPRGQKGQKQVAAPPAAVPGPDKEALRKLVAESAQRHGLETEAAFAEAMSAETVAEARADEAPEQE